MAEVAKLNAAKAEYKSVAGHDWTPDLVDAVLAKQSTSTVSSAIPSATTSGAGGLSDRDRLLLDIKATGDRVRELKAAKADKPTVEATVQQLLAQKAEFRQLTGQDWTPKLVDSVAALSTATPASATPSSAAPAMSSAEGDALKAKVDEQGGRVRQLKEAKADKPSIDAAVAELLSLKAQYKQLTGADYVAAGGGRQKKDKPAAKPADAAKANGKKAAPQQQPAVNGDAAADGKKQTKLGLDVKKTENFADWYSQVITKAEMIEYYDVSGCYVLRPWAFALWEAIQAFFDAEIKKLGVENGYFPMFVSHAALEREKAHISDFAPEVAWVTKCGDSTMAEPVAIRPTSETVMYPSYSKWVQSHRDLPIKINQWCNVVRWEFKHPTPFLRTREFLWQEGHSAFATEDEAKEEVYTILDLYRQVYEDLLAIPVIKGHKTEKEKFAGGDFTTTVEAYIPQTGRGIQGATSHHLGQNFSRMFDITFEDPDSHEKQFAYQNSWGITTRTIGVFTMVHSDDNGLVLPPHIARYQAIIIPCGITATLPKEKEAELLAECQAVRQLLLEAGVRVHADLRMNYSPGWKYNHWELKGVPVRIEIGPRDLASASVVAVRRDLGSKETISKADLPSQLPRLLDTIHQQLFTTAKAAYDSHTIETESWTEFVAALDRKCVLVAPFCGECDCEDNIKKQSASAEPSEPGAPAMGAKSLCIPFDQPEAGVEGKRCIHPDCRQTAKFWCLFGRSY